MDSEALSYAQTLTALARDVDAQLVLKVLEHELRGSEVISIQQPAYFQNIVLHGHAVQLISQVCGKLFSVALVVRHRRRKQLNALQQFAVGEPMQIICLS
jgi:hypothetical protein